MFIRLIVLFMSLLCIDDDQVFSGLLPSLVTAQFASQYLLMLSAANLGGRLVWAGVSDAIGRRNTFHIFTLGSIPMYLLIPTIVDSVIQSSSSVPLAMFIGSTCFCVSVMGGTYAILPPYESDLFGTKFVGANHGRMLLYSSAAALAGPNILMYLRSMSEKTAINDLLSKVLHVVLSTDLKFIL
jgi:MFS family permease